MSSIKKCVLITNYLRWPMSRWPWYCDAKKRTQNSTTESSCSYGTVCQESTQKCVL